MGRVPCARHLQFPTEITRKGLHGSNHYAIQVFLHFITMLLFVGVPGFAFVSNSWQVTERAQILEE